MICPNCMYNMEKGYLHAPTLAWMKSERGFLRPQVPEESFLTRDRFALQPLQAFFCPHCGILLLGGESPLSPDGSAGLCPCCSGGLTDGFLRGGGDLVWAKSPYRSMRSALADGSSRLLTNRFASFSYPARRCDRCSHILFSIARLTSEQVRASRLVRRLYPVLFSLCLLFAALAAMWNVSYFALLLVLVLELGGLRLLYAAAGGK